MAYALTMKKGTSDQKRSLQVLERAEKDCRMLNREPFLKWHKMSSGILTRDWSNYSVREAISQVDFWIFY
ncbi:hypothetical protein KRR40_39110 [Niabella defluvii]|nr:hypothetical protein KRR40_39110 [Niabella sp. I65]